MAMKIGGLADRARTSVKTIRYYDGVGVLRAQERAPSGYRLYGEDALDRYRFIRAARAVGFRFSSLSATRIKRRANSSPG
jgi:DNA-binding transcriptional MerR regulator